MGKAGRHSERVLGDFMKKSVAAGTALVAVAVLSAGSAQASEKISLRLGGYSKWWVVGAWESDSYQGATQTDENSVDVKGDNEIYFQGSTTLDNGLQIGVDIQLEGGGHSVSNSRAANAGADMIDESYVWLAGGFGKLELGSKNNGAYQLHVTAPDAAGNWNEEGLMADALAIPTHISGISPLQHGWDTTAILTDNDSEGVTYFTPSLHGLTLAATYKPSSSEDNRGNVNLSTGATAGAVTGEFYALGGLYAETFNDVGVKLSAGWASYDFNVPSSTSVDTGDDHVFEYSLGGQLSYAGFTFGSSYRRVLADRGNLQATADLDLNAQAWDLGVQYAFDRYAVSMAYYRSEADGSDATEARDIIEFYLLSGKYALGPGVDLLASVGHANYTSEDHQLAEENDGWTVMSGLSLTF